MPCSASIDLTASIGCGGFGWMDERGYTRNAGMRSQLGWGDSVASNVSRSCVADVGVPFQRANSGFAVLGSSASCTLPLASPCSSLLILS